MWDGGPIPGELGQFPGYLMARLGEASRRRFHKALEPEGLHPRHFGVMTMLAAHPGMSQQQLHEKTGIDPSSMVAVIDELQERGLAERRPDPMDRRARQVFLTEQGLAALERIRGLAANLQREFFGALTAEERKTLHALLRKLAGSGV
ncbi:MAG TPA: MarR family winged helix-turn-helix transcriptional regulator [Solirubrobacteraceae bacterium]|jgi:DNA-binding MarR family transcriptional regulator|nr:MarR family winged helix-turn-helix transcriptional regulator [Solirubrobacteraceae bacterium]